MKKTIAQIALLTALLRALDETFLGALLAIAWRILAALQAFSRNEVTPRSFERLECRLDPLCQHE